MNDSLAEKERIAISHLRAFEPQDGKGYYLCYSGGKDSDVIRILAELANVKRDVVHNLTTVDAPETVYYVRSVPEVIVERPPKSMWRLIAENTMPPTRIVRYCCAKLKERGGTGRLKVTGVRKAESSRRAERSDLVNIIGKPVNTQKFAAEIGADFRVNRQNGLVMNDDNDEARRLVEHCYRTRKTMINPIVDWSDDDVWEFLHYYGCKSNPLYQCGFKRIGCIGCPMGGGKHQKQEFEIYPKYRALYVRAFEKMLDNIHAKKINLRVNWQSGEDILRWWVGDDPQQISIEDLENLAAEYDVL